MRKSREIEKLSNKEKEEKLNELRLELIKKNVAANRSSKIKAKEIKKSIARLLTSLRLNTQQSK
jgi:ribosomal protein L29